MSKLLSDDDGAEMFITAQPNIVAARVRVTCLMDFLILPPPHTHTAKINETDTFGPGDDDEIQFDDIGDDDEDIDDVSKVYSVNISSQFLFNKLHQLMFESQR